MLFYMVAFIWFVVCFSLLDYVESDKSGLIVVVSTIASYWWRMVI